VEKTFIEVVLLGSLVKRFQEVSGHSKLLELQGPVPLPEVLKLLSIPPDKVQLAMVNHRAVAPDCLIRPGDRVTLFPKEYPLFADWKDFRSSNH
jgi:hypothetical protein